MDYIAQFFYGIAHDPDRARWMFAMAIGMAVSLFSLSFMLLITGIYNPLRRRLSSVLGKEPIPSPSYEPLTRAMEPILPYVLPKREAKRAKIRMRLIWAGYRSGSALGTFYAIRLLLSLMFGTAALFTALVFPGVTALQAAYIALIMSLIGYLIPNFVLSRRIDKRKWEIMNGFPDAIDLLVTCSEAGLGLNGAFQRVASELAVSYPALAQELSLVNAEIRAGVDRVEALKSLAERTGLEDIRGLVSLLSQSLRFGTSVADALRIYSEEFRDKRMQRAEEQAAKLSTKMIFPLAFCLFPAMFIIGAGPAIIGAIRALQEMR